MIMDVVMPYKKIEPILDQKGGKDAQHFLLIQNKNQTSIDVLSDSE